MCTRGPLKNYYILRMACISQKIVQSDIKIKIVPCYFVLGQKAYSNQFFKIFRCGISVYLQLLRDKINFRIWMTKKIIQQILTIDFWKFFADFVFVMLQSFPSLLSPCPYAQSVLDSTCVQCLLLGFAWGIKGENCWTFASVLF